MSTGTKVPLDVAETLAADLLNRLDGVLSRATIAGSIRRREPAVSDVEIVAEPKEVATLLATEPDVEAVQHAARQIGEPTKLGRKYIQVPDVLGSGLTLDLFLVTPPADWGSILTIRTGPAGYSQWLVTKLRRRGLRCSGGRVLDGDNKVVPCPTERDFFQACGVEYVPPEKRGR